MMTEDAVADRLVTRSSGNVFRDLGLPNPALMQAKADLLFWILHRIERDAVTLVDLKLDPDEAMAINGHRPSSFTLDRLWEIAEAAALEITLSVKGRSGD